MTTFFRFLAPLVIVAGVSSILTAQSPSTAPKMIRRVLTANTPQGKSYVVSDERVPAGGALLNVFRAPSREPLGEKVGGDARILPNETADFGLTAGGTGLHFFEMAPSSPAQPAKPNWHRTTTIDYVMVTSGTIELILDEGSVMLHAGDVAIQRNTRHAWRNPSTTERATAWVVVGGLDVPPQK
jgi:hypothetical protein